MQVYVTTHALLPAEPNLLVNQGYAIIIDSDSIVVVVVMAAIDLSKAMIRCFKWVGRPKKVNIRKQVVSGVIRLDTGASNLDDAVCKVFYMVAVGIIAIKMKI